MKRYPNLIVTSARCVNRIVRKIDPLYSILVAMTSLRRKINVSMIYLTFYINNFILVHMNVGLLRLLWPETLLIQ